MLKRLDHQGFSTLGEIHLIILLEIQMFMLVHLMRSLISELILRSEALAILMCRLMPPIIHNARNYSSSNQAREGMSQVRNSLAPRAQHANLGYPRCLESGHTGPNCT